MTAYIHRINELESGIERLRNHQEILKRKLKKQSGKKTKLEVSIVCDLVTYNCSYGFIVSETRVRV